MTGQRRVDPSAVRYLIGRIKQAKVSGQKQEYQRQGRDVNNTRQKSGSQAQVQSSKVGQSNTEITDSMMNNTHKCQPGQEQRSVCMEVCCLNVCVCERGAGVVRQSEQMSDW